MLDIPQSVIFESRFLYLGVSVFLFVKKSKYILLYATTDPTVCKHHFFLTRMLTSETNREYPLAW